MTNAPPGSPGRGSARVGLISVLPPAARPDQVVVVVLAIEEVGEDGRVEARVVELDGKVVATLSGALGPGGANLGSADKDPVGGRAVAAPIGLGDDADAPRLHAQRDDLALKLRLGHLSTVLFAESSWAIDVYRYRTDRTVFFASVPFDSIGATERGARHDK